MPLFHNARQKMRTNLEKIRDGNHPSRIAVGTLNQNHLEAINAQKLEEELPTITDEIFFIGRHIYESRLDGNGYTIEDVLDQIYSGMDENSIVVKEGIMTGMRNPTKRLDRYGKYVNDVVVFQCTGFNSNPQLYGVIPKGDGGGPKTKKGPSQVQAVPSSDA